jgi:hypothetical protein
MEGGRTVFVSYARLTLARVQKLVPDLHRLGFHVWFDRELSGGQKWWDEILKNILSCDYFVVALSDAWLASTPCKAEWQYARAANRAILYVKVSSFDDKLLPKVIAESNYIDYQHRTVESYDELRKAFDHLLPSPPPPDPLPDPPKVPISDLGAIKQRLDDTGALLTPRAQETIFQKLQLCLGKADTKEQARSLLVELRERHEITLSIAQAIDTLLAQCGPDSVNVATDSISKMIGLVAVHKDCDAKWFCALFDRLKAGQELLWHDTYCPHWNEMKDAIHRALDKGARLRMLIIDPACDNARFRAEELEVSGWGDFEKFKLEGSVFLSTMQRLADKIAELGSPAPMEVRVYRDLPGFPFYLVQEAGQPISGFSSFFLTQATGFHFVHLEWKPSECGLLQLMSMHFEAKWERQAILSEITEMSTK